VRERDTVIAAGFPFNGDRSDDRGFKFTTGIVSLIAPKSLEDGYQIGYTNQIEKGMSGGPVLNLQGEVVAINGMHAYPLWGDPYIYQDGEKPSRSLHDIMVCSSWGIPINTFLQLAPDLIGQKK
jgi:S1-C subfamily serine protease